MPAARGAELETALRQAVRANVRSMNELHYAIGQCVASLRADGMQCEASLLTMKAFIRQLGLKHERIGSRDLMHVEVLMDQIVRWCISDYYRDTQ